MISIVRNASGRNTRRPIFQEPRVEKMGASPPFWAACFLVPPGLEPHLVFVPVGTPHWEWGATLFLFVNSKRDIGDSDLHG